jgi:hypothetical protein
VTANEPDRLPTSIGGLIDLAFAVCRERAGLYVGVSLAVVVCCGAFEWLWPGDSTREIKKTIVVQLADLFTDALAIATVALGVGGRLAGADASSRTLLLAGIDRWLPALGAMTLAQFVVAFTGPLGAIDTPRNDPTTWLATPLVWLLWGALSLAPPMAVLSTDRPALAIITGFARALMNALRVVNLGRLCIVAFVTIIPFLLQSLLFDTLLARHVAHAWFWANIPIDALTVVPLGALQATFALDFARRVEATKRP